MGLVTRHLVGLGGIVVGIVVVSTVVLFALDTNNGEETLLRGQFHPFTSDPDNDGCAPSADAVGNVSSDCDPINLVFEDLSLEDIVAALRGAGWVTVGLGSVQWLAFGGPGGPTAQDAQLFFADALDERLHLRVWTAASNSDTPVVLGAVHHEQGILTHRIDQDWERAEQRLRAMLCAGSGLVCEQGQPIALQLAIQGNDERWRGWVNDGRPTLVRPAAGDASRDER